MSETRKLAAILVADVVGYSRLAGADEDRTLSRLRALRSDLIDPTIAAHHGRIVKRTGDGVIIEFRSVVDAVRCGIEIQNGLIERNAGVPEDRRIEFRVGIHVGDVVEESDGDLMGDGVNIAARLEGVASPAASAFPRTPTAGEEPARPGGDRSRPDTAQEHRRAGAGLFAGRQRGRPEKARETGRTRSARSAQAAEEASRARAARRRAGSAGHPDHGRRVVVPRRQPARRRRCKSARRGRAAFDRRAALRRPLCRSGAGLPCRRAHRRTDHQSRTHPRRLRHRAIRP